MFSQRVEIALSPCPNDVFILSGLILGSIKTTLEVGFIFADIEELNTWALEGRFSVIKASFALYPQIASNYEIMGCGSAIGFGLGPLLVSLREVSFNPANKNSINKRVALPGRFTTANFLMDFLFPQVYEKVYLPYHEIIPTLLAQRVDYGVLIHEGRFVFEKYGLKLVADLGKLWEQATKLPLPLGGFFIKRSLPEELKRTLLWSFRRSLEFAQKNRKEVYFLLKQHAQELEPEVIFKHVDTYVNRFTYKLTKEAVESFRVFFQYLRFAFDPKRDIWECEDGIY